MKAFVYRGPHLGREFLKAFIPGSGAVERGQECNIIIQKDMGPSLLGKYQVVVENPNQESNTWKKILAGNMTDCYIHFDDIPSFLGEVEVDGSMTYGLMNRKGRSISHRGRMSYISCKDLENHGSASILPDTDGCDIIDEVLLPFE